ncbi:pyridoxamine 5'-phosphate oxidase family protein [Nocardiopsis sp. YSL2]|uniref:pyridoxamine 5'-phosphate oxidase family protein n=1 Tax=Nocardiopsis sp. YSL2 TaxID=2939492 RepID=UPI0026F47B17|nr:pyridoxamine 5'-phosphate oxidase family protein [Nocardiopsis sp. YSL2]
MGSYHRGELAVQERAALSRQAGHTARAIRASVPDVAADFLAARTFLVVGAADTDGRTWCSLLTGPPGFLRVPDENTLDVAALPHRGDPLAERLRQGPAPVGALALDPARRRRMRVNGTVRPHGPGLRVATEDVYANCPKYIQKRTPVPTAPTGPEPVHGDALTPGQQALVRRADTFFVATRSDTGHADANHRGGGPGFLRVHSPTLLSWPDYVGNAMFNTLGNLWVEPRAGLLVPDWETGDTLRLTGRARVLWDEGSPTRERSVEFTVDGVVATAGGGLLAPEPPEYSTANPPVDPPA